MVEVKCFIKNYKKVDKTTQVLTCVVEGQNGKLYKEYFVNVSKEKGTCYLTEIKREK